MDHLLTRWCYFTTCGGNCRFNASNESDRFCGRVSSTNDTSWIGKLVSCDRTSGIHNHLATTHTHTHTEEGTGERRRMSRSSGREKKKESVERGMREVWNSASSGSQRRTNFHKIPHCTVYFWSEGHPIAKENVSIRIPQGRSRTQNYCSIGTLSW